MKYVAIGLAGALGALSRYSLGIWIAALMPVEFPIGTLVANLTGAFLLGVVATYGIERGRMPAAWHLPVTVGFLGSYTTFSTWTVETVLLMEAGEWAWAGLNVVGSLSLGLLAVWLGHRLANRVGRRA